VCAGEGACLPGPRYPVKVASKQLPQPDVSVTHQGQRRQEVLAELPVGYPRAALPVPLEGKRVDKDRLAFHELHVVGAAILEGHPELEGFPLDVERGEGCVFELAETPLIGVGYERYLLGPYDLVGKLRSGAS